METQLFELREMGQIVELFRENWQLEVNGIGATIMIVAVQVVPPKKAGVQIRTRLGEHAADSFDVPRRLAPPSNLISSISNPPRDDADERHQYEQASQAKLIPAALWLVAHVRLRRQYFIGANL